MSLAQTIRNARKVIVALAFGTSTCLSIISYYPANTPHSAIILNLATTYWHHPMNIAPCECCDL